MAVLSCNVDVAGAASWSPDTPEGSLTFACRTSQSRDTTHETELPVSLLSCLGFAAGVRGSKRDR